MSTLRTPPYKVTGLWKLQKPWSCNPVHVYTCIAIRKFDEIILDQGDVFRDFYYPVGLSYTTFENDRDAGASIVTILSEHGEEIHVPDTFIISYPEVNLADYHHIVLSASLGPLPSKADLTNVKTKVATLLESVVGKKPEIKVHSAPLTNAITVKQAKQAEEVRQAAITDRSTSYATVSELEKKYSDSLTATLVLKKYVARLEAEKAELMNNAGSDKLKAENTRLEKEVAKLSAENVKLKTEKTEAVKAENVRLSKIHEEEKYKLNQEIFELRNQLKAAKVSVPVAATQREGNVDWIRERVLQEQEMMRRRSTDGLKQSVREKLEAQSQPKAAESPSSAVTSPVSPPQQ